MQDDTPELKNLLAAVYNATIGITNQTCPMYNAVRGTYGNDFCDICLFSDTGLKCKIRTLKSAYQNYLVFSKVVPIHNFANPDQPEDRTRTEINKTDPADAPDYLEILEESI